MKFHTENETATFDFQEAYVQELRFGTGTFYMLLDNVKILESNSKNRDVRTMRTNGLELRILDAQVLSVIEEGCKIYNADGVLQQEIPDRKVELSEYNELCKALQGAFIYLLKRNEQAYEIALDGEEHAYTLYVKGTKDLEDWNRFMNMEEVL